MYRNKTKAFEMSRSILPSTSRREARYRKRALQHKNRAQIREKLASFKGPADYVLDAYDDDYRDLNHVWTPRCDDTWDPIIFDRRNSDKLNHFVRWAGRKIEGMEAEEGWALLRSLVPEGLIGDHALTHLYEYDPKFAMRYSWWNNTTPPVMTPNKLMVDEFNALLLSKMEEVIATTAQLRKFNKLYYAWCVAELKAKEDEEERKRDYAKRWNQPHRPQTFKLNYVKWDRRNYRYRFNRQIAVRFRRANDKWGEAIFTNDLTEFFASFVKVNIPVINE